MDLMALKQFALNLQGKLEEYADDENVAALAEELGPLLEQAVAGELVDLIEYDEVPGAEMFDEGVFEEYEDLEEAYADFQVEVSGGEDLGDDEEDEDE